MCRLERSSSGASSSMTLINPASKMPLPKLEIPTSDGGENPDSADEDFVIEPAMEGLKWLLEMIGEPEREEELEGSPDEAEEKDDEEDDEEEEESSSPRSS